MPKSFQELTIRDSFMFAAVMEDAELCRELLRRVLGMEITSVTVRTEDTLVYRSDVHGVRLDVHAVENGSNRHFNVEMQVETVKALPKRCRYYHSQMDMGQLSAGEDYGKLPDTYVIFICNFDPMGKGLYRYTFDTRCAETGAYLKEGRHTILLSTKGKNRTEVPKELVSFLDYVENAAPEPGQEAENGDSYVESLEQKVAHVKRSRGKERQYMLLQLTLEEARQEGRAEGLLQGQQAFILSLLGRRGEVPKDVEERIRKETDAEVLNRWLFAASDAGSLEDFLKEM